jgi:hypothetical protein
VSALTAVSTLTAVYTTSNALQSVISYLSYVGN